MKKTMYNIQKQVIRVRRHYEKNNYPEMPYDTNDKNYFPNTTMYGNLSSTYNLTNYSYAVNFKMYLGTHDNGSAITTSELYVMERGSTPGKTATDSYGNSVSFIGSVGIMYPSDYGYGVLSSDCERTRALHFYSKEACYNNNWLSSGSVTQWLISPVVSSSGNAFQIWYNAVYLYNEPTKCETYVAQAHTYSPVMALSNEVLVNGSGTKSDPYTMVY